MEEVLKFYSLRISGLEAEIQHIKSRFTYIYLLRLVCFFAAIALLVLYFSDRESWALWLSLLCFAVFGVLVRLDLKYSARSKYLNAKLKINEQEVEILKGNYSSRPSGEQYASIDNHLTADFDIVGRGSMFQYLNRCTTRTGERLFVTKLCRAELSNQTILDRQEAVAELADRMDFIQDFESYGSYFDESQTEIDYLKAWALEQDHSLARMNIIRFVAPIFMLLCVAVVVLGLLPASALAVPFIVNIFLVNINMAVIAKGHNKLDRTSKIIRKYTRLITLIENEEFSASYLASNKSHLYTNGVSASRLSSRLFSLLNLLDSRQNMFTALVLNSLCGFDVQVYCSLAKWKQENGAYLEKWIDAVAEFDALIPLAVFAFNNKSYTCLPEVSSREFEIKAYDLAHPLMSVDTRISNDIEISKAPALVIITGANMAGKSTFLRTVAVNLILAMNGSRVCASKFSFAPSDILSSIKIQDSLSKNESYFYAEISRLKQIVENVDRGQRTLVVLDEILRGTNNKDKQQGSMGLLKKLIKDNAIVFVATHDLVIGELEESFPDIACNYCFEVELEDNRLIFDYKLKNGVSKKLNASFLLKKMGLID